MSPKLVVLIADSWRRELRAMAVASMWFSSIRWAIMAIAMGATIAIIFMMAPEIMPMNWAMPSAA